MLDKAIYFKIKTAFEESGIVFAPDDEDPVLSEYILDSIQYISSIVNIENALDIEIPDELLLPEQMRTLKSFSQILECIVNGEEISEVWDDDSKSWDE